MGVDRGHGFSDTGGDGVDVVLPSQILAALREIMKERIVLSQALDDAENSSSAQFDMRSVPEPEPFLARVLRG